MIIKKLLIRKEKIDRFGYIKINNFCLLREL